MGPGKKRAGGGLVGRLAPREKINFTRVRLPHQFHAALCARFHGFNQANARRSSIERICVYRVRSCVRRCRERGNVKGVAQKKSNYGGCNEG